MTTRDPTFISNALYPDGWPYDYPQFIEADQFGMPRVTMPGQIVVPFGSLGDDGLPTNVGGTSTGIQFGTSAAGAIGGSADGTGIDQLRYLFPGWPDSLLTLFQSEWVATGDTGLALARVRASDEYADFFPGIRRDDGSLRMVEADYFSARDIFNAELESIGLNPVHFGGTFAELVGGDVSPREMVARIESAYSQIIDRAPEIVSFYASEFGFEITPSAIVASFLDPRVGEQILNRRISIAEIGGQANIRDLDIDFELVERLFEVGVTTAQATEAFGDAAELLPVLNVLAGRHNDPDDTFDLNEFVGGQLLDDPFQRRRMRGLLAQERAKFTERGVFTEDRQGTLSGLTLR
jgi:hypothetical protein